VVIAVASKIVVVVVVLTDFGYLVRVAGAPSHFPLLLAEWCRCRERNSLE
jgi:hypothetical protein